mmetsp:Transcript_30537/g.77342  ORF Transcript_30537/g.77342 Transcript_30537/m.77342 type:complete len:201 (+) Transcript_30537:103-705(+)
MVAASTIFCALFTLFCAVLTLSCNTALSCSGAACHLASATPSLASATRCASGGAAFTLRSSASAASSFTFAEASSPSASSSLRCAPATSPAAVAIAGSPQGPQPPRQRPSPVRPSVCHAPLFSAALPDPRRLPSSSPTPLGYAAPDQRRPHRPRPRRQAQPHERRPARRGRTLRLCTGSTLAGEKLFLQGWFAALFEETC